MEASAVLRLDPCAWSYRRKGDGGRSGPVGGRRIRGEEKASRKVDFAGLRLGGEFNARRDGVVRRVCCSYRKSEAVETNRSRVPIDEDLILKKKAASVAHHLGRRCIYLVGMMGSGKSTVGRILSEALGYSFVDSDTLIEEAVGCASVAQIFEQHSESFFRDNETRVLQDLSLEQQKVVATGGGAVIRSVNWQYMKHGISVWLDVPLEALARRIAAVGTASRPLLHQETGDAYTKAFLRLQALSEERGESYRKADVTVSLERIASKEWKGDVNALTPSTIAMEALEKIEDFLTSSGIDGDNLSKDEA